MFLNIHLKKKMIEILVGFISGIISGIGLGGGTILILFLTVFGGYEQHIAQATNLIFFIPTSITAIIINSRQKLIKYKMAIPITIIGIIGAIIGAKIATKLEMGILRKIFAIFLLLIAIKEICSIYNMYRKGKREHNRNKETR